jgi:outer membrane lipoprotein carrier protein
MRRVLATTLLALATWSGALGARAGTAEAPAPGSGGQPGAPAQPTSCLDRTVDLLQSRYERVTDLRAHFVQTTRAAYTGTIAPDPVTSRGRMVVAKPAKMRWVYEEPDESIVVSDGTTLWIYDPAFKEAQSLPVGEGFLSGVAVQFLLGEGDLRRDFAIALISCSEDDVEIELTPRTPASYERLRIVVEPDTGSVIRTQIDDLLGNQTVLELSKLETNVHPEPELFRFVAPEGVSVIELDPAGGQHR